MSNQSAELRNDNNEHLYTLDCIDVETFLWLAQEGAVDQFKIRKKGREVLVFRLKPKTPPRTVDGSKPTDCDLTEKDSKVLAGLYGRPNRFQIERWMGYGLIPAH